jgi:hypothetical protein
VSAPKKKISRASLCFYIRIFFETALKSDIRQWSSRRYRRHHRYRRRHRRSGSIDERKMNNVKGDC